MDSRRRFISHFGISWIVLCLALAVHVADETVNGFLQIYNPMVRNIKEHLPYLPLPEFKFEIWIGGLILGLLILLFLSPLAFRQVKWLRYFSYIFGILMIFNGIIHFAGTIYLGRPMPGVYSSPLLIASSIYLLISLRLSKRKISTAS
ncbi:MAG TPA: HXXEE domain-containing protein [archaeon]|nr:HXXEE domain-containing protein [archaeon]